MTLTAYNGSVTLNSNVTTNNGGSLTINADEGDLTINDGLSVSGYFYGSASNNILIGEIDPTIGSYLQLSAGGEIEFDNNTTINGSLTLSAGTFIHTPDESEIFGATSVTLTLNDAPPISAKPRTTPPHFSSGSPRPMRWKDLGHSRSISPM